MFFTEQLLFVSDSPLFFFFIQTCANCNRLFAFLAFDITAPIILAFTALFDLFLKCLESSTTTHVCTTALSCCLGIALASRCPQSPDGLTFFAIVRRSSQSNEIHWRVRFASPRFQSLIILSLVRADYMNYLVVSFLENRCHTLEVA